MIYSECDKRVLPLALLAMAVVAIALGLLLRRRSERVRSIPTIIVAVVLLFIEVIKQRYNILGEFNLFWLPFHYCSLFFVVVPLAELFGKRCTRIFRPIATCMTFMVSVALYVYPKGILGNATEMLGTNFKLTHSFVFHMLIVFYLLLVVALRLCRPRVIDAVHVGVVGMVFTAVVLPISYVLDTNYSNFLESVIPIFEDFRLEYGQTAYTIAVVFFITVGATFSGLVYIGIERGVLKLLALCRKGVRRLLGKDAPVQEDSQSES